ncbi:MAG: VOC family protein [Chloroflexi bacterium]|nr:VOC family protein [Chloroflexota bacterium]MCI0575432.1 VOC family protein [Chloroflexota bacterium]MCI0649886.1 VOC family protein [Chloroflexota bacterium]MCI0725656.1 VOC family protein [Chloroflexota bacterium]
MAGNSVVHIELASTNPEGTGEFYRQLFGWKIEASPFGEGQVYVQFQPDSGPGGGFPGADGQMFKPGETLVYVGVEDIEATLARAESLGGKTVLPKTEIPGVGHFAILIDPHDSKIALYTSMNQ